MSESVPVTAPALTPQTSVAADGTAAGARGGQNQSFSGVLADAQGTVASDAGSAGPATGPPGPASELQDPAQTIAQQLLTGGNLLPQSNHPGAVPLADTTGTPALPTGTTPTPTGVEAPISALPSTGRHPAQISLPLALDGGTGSNGSDRFNQTPLPPLPTPNPGVLAETLTRMAAPGLSADGISDAGHRNLADGLSAFTALGLGNLKPVHGLDAVPINARLAMPLPIVSSGSTAADAGMIMDQGSYTGLQLPAQPAVVPNTGGTSAVMDMGTVNFDGRQFGPELDQQVMWLARANVNAARVRLNPPNLGPVEIKITMNNGDANVQFVSAHAGVREALEIAVPRLRESLADIGLSLSDASVSDYSRDEHQQTADSGWAVDPAFAEADQAHTDGIDTEDGEWEPGYDEMGSTLISVYA